MTKYRLDSIDEIFTIYVGGDAPCNRHFSSIKDSKFFIPVVSNGKGEDAVRGYTDIPKIAPPVITISARGTIGHVGYYNNAIYPTVRLLCLKPKQDDSPLFMYYAAKSLHYPDSTTVIPQLTSPMIHQIRLPRPPVSSQNRIAQLLSLTDKVIHYNKSLARELSAIVSLIYNYWFVQFDFPDENGRPYKSSGGKMVYNDQLKQEVPEGWKVSDLANTNLATVIKPGINNFIGEKTYLATGDVNGNSISDKVKSITYINRESRANMQPTYNSVWFAKMKDSVKHIVITDKSSDLVDQCILSTGFCGLQANDTTVCYLAAYISQPQFEQTKDMLAHGATQKAISNSDLINIAILEPDDATLQKFANIVYPMLELMSNCRQMSRQLASLRDWLLPMLMNGQVKIRERKETSSDKG